MASIDVNSLTWKAILSFIEEQHKEAVKNLIADHQSEQQRGVINCLEKLKKTAVEHKEEAVTEVNYNQIGRS
jgi:hypothetical protein